jgi:hypothetical protein
MLANRAVGENLKRLNVDYLDLTPAFVAEAATSRLYRNNDSHWNIAGNRLAAGLIAEYLVTRLRAK